MNASFDNEKENDDKNKTKRKQLLGFFFLKKYFYIFFEVNKIQFDTKKLFHMILMPRCLVYFK